MDVDQGCHLAYVEYLAVVYDYVTPLGQPHMRCTLVPGEALRSAAVAYPVALASVRLGFLDTICIIRKRWCAVSASCLT